MATTEQDGGNGGGRKDKPARPITGSGLSTKQLQRTVLDGRQVTFHFAAGIPVHGITGYICGMDDFHWMVVTSRGQQHLIHKGSAVFVTLAETPSWNAEPIREQLDEVVGPYRQWVARNVFGRDPQPAREAITA